MEYSPRSPEDLEKIANLVKVAVGFDEDRSDKLEVINMRFSSDFESIDESDSDWIREELPNLFQTLIFAIVVLLVLITVIRPIALKAFEVKNNTDSDGFPKAGGVLDGMMAKSEGEFSAESASLLDEALEESAGLKKQSSDAAIRKVDIVVETHPQDLVNVLRKWLNEGN